MSQHIALTFALPLESEEILKGYFLVNYEVEGFEETPNGEIKIYVQSDDWNEESLQDFLASHTAITLKASETIEDKDWNAAWEAGIEPVKISEELVITPSWKIEDAKKIAAKHFLIIDPKMSFGTGHHETTRLCLRILETLDCTGTSILDIGTGTGALAMYALVRGADRAVGIDTDEWSFQNAKENRAQNNISEQRFDIRHGDLAAAVSSDELFDIILANIHRNILLSTKNEIALHQKNGSVLILSGILEYDAEEVIAAYQSIGYTLKEKKQEDEWIALLFVFAGKG